MLSGLFNYLWLFISINLHDQQSMLPAFESATHPHILLYLLVSPDCIIQHSPVQIVRHPCLISAVPQEVPRVMDLQRCQTIPTGQCLLFQQRHLTRICLCRLQGWHQSNRSVLPKLSQRWKLDWRLHLHPGQLRRLWRVQDPPWILLRLQADRGKD